MSSTAHYSEASTEVLVSKVLGHSTAHHSQLSYPAMQRWLSFLVWICVNITGPLCRVGGTEGKVVGETLLCPECACVQESWASLQSPSWDTLSGNGHKVQSQLPSSSRGRDLWTACIPSCEARQRRVVPLTCPQDLPSQL